MIKPENVDLQKFIPKAQRQAKAMGAGALAVNLINGTDTYMSGSSVESDIAQYKELGDDQMVEYLTKLIDLIDAYNPETHVLISLVGVSREAQTFTLPIE